MQSHHRSSQTQPELPMRPDSDMQVALAHPCHYVTDENGKTKIIIEKPTGPKTFDYPHSPLALINAFQESLSINEEYATQLTVMVLTCLNAYRSIAKEIKILANPDKIESSDNLTQQKKVAKAFIAKITNLELELQQELKINVRTLHEKGGSDYLEDITIMQDERRIELSSNFLSRLKQEVAQTEPYDKREAAFQHFALTVEAVVIHLLDQGYENELVIRDLLACTKKIVEATQDPIAGAVFLQSNLHHFNSHKTFGGNSTTDQLLSAQNIRHLNNDYLSAVLMSDEQIKPFLARIPLTSEILNEKRCFDYVRHVQEALQGVCKLLDTKLENIWKVFAKLETQEERKIFFEQITQNPASFVIYQLNSPNPPQAIQKFVNLHLNRKQFYLEQTAQKIILGKDSNGNASLIDLVALAHKRLSSSFIKSHNTAETSLATILDTLTAEPGFLKVFNLLCNQTNKMEVVFDDLFACSRAKDETRFQGYLTIVEKSGDLATVKKFAAQLKTLTLVPVDPEELLAALNK